MIKRALISVSDKQGIIKLAKGLERLKIAIYSTGGTLKALKQAKIKAKSITSLTQFPEIMDGRVKTLHPKIHGGLLARRQDKSHLEQAKKQKIKLIDLVVCNLYPFERTIKKLTDDDNACPEQSRGSHCRLHAKAIENIDIGGPSMIRSAAKNFESVTVIVDPADYSRVLQQLKEQGKTTPELRQELATKAFALTSRYDSLIYNYFSSDKFPSELRLNYTKAFDLRYGENPHQEASFYREYHQPINAVSRAKVIQGKQLSFNNILDADAAINLIKGFSEPTVAIVKHNNPCGVASAKNIDQAYTKAYQTDPLSAFGGIIMLNRPCTVKIAKRISQVFAEIVIAPIFPTAVLKLLAKKKNLRLLAIGQIVPAKKSLDYKKVLGGLLVQDNNLAKASVQRWQLVTSKSPNKQQTKDLQFAWKVVRQVKSNAIVLVKNQTTVGVGAGQMSRVDSTELALKKAGAKTQGAVCASDAFFPFSDSIKLLAQAGVKAIIQPGGSLKDKVIIKAVNQKKLAMVFTGVRAFKH